jgi:hypothetical protein
MRPAMGQTSISRQEALKIAKKQCIPPIDEFTIYDQKPSGRCIYGLKDDEEYWCVAPPGNGGMVASSHAIVISKKTGDVVYDGSANDEG